MMKRFSFLMAIAITLTTMFSCQKEEINKDLDIKTTESLITDQHNATLDTTGFANIATILKQKETPTVEDEKIAANRGNNCDNPIVLACGDSYTGSTVGAGDNFVASSYSFCIPNSWTFWGEDLIFELDVPTDRYLTIDMTNLSADLDVFLFDYLCGFHYPHCMDYSINFGNANEKIGPIFVQAGTYHIVVDGYHSSVAGSFKLEVDCPCICTTIYDPVCANGVTYSNACLAQCAGETTWTPGTCCNVCTGSGVPVVCEDFENYAIGDISPQSYHFERWSGVSTDGGVTGNRAYQGIKSMQIKGNNFGPSQDDVLMKLGDQTDGVYHLNMKMLMPHYKSGYFNLQKYQNIPGQEYGFELYFYSNGTAKVRIGGYNYYFAYQQNKWLDIDIYFNIHDNETYLYVDSYASFIFPGSYTASGTWGHNRVGAIDFYAFEANTEFYIDNVCFESLAFCPVGTATGGAVSGMVTEVKGEKEAADVPTKQSLGN